MQQDEGTFCIISLSGALLLVAYLVGSLIGSLSVTNKKAKKCIEKKNYTCAINELKKEIEKKPNDAEAYFLLGKVYEQLDSIEQMKIYFERAKKVDNDSVYTQKINAHLRWKSEKYLEKSKNASNMMTALHFAKLSLLLDNDNLDAKERITSLKKAREMRAKESTYVDEAQKLLDTENYEKAYTLLKDAKKELEHYASSQFLTIYKKAQLEALKHGLKPESEEEARALYDPIILCTSPLVMDYKGRYCTFFHIDQVIPGEGFLSSAEQGNQTFTTFFKYPNTDGLCDHMRRYGIGKIVGTHSYRTVSGKTKKVPMVEVVYIHKCDSCYADRDGFGTMNGILYCPKECTGETRIFSGKIIQILPGTGFLIQYDEVHIIFCEYKKTDDLIDDMTIIGEGKILGTYSYETNLGYVKTVPKIRVISFRRAY